jgi:hypothetical protein
MSDAQKPLPTFAALQQRNVQEQLTPEETASVSPPPVTEPTEKAPPRPKGERKNVHLYKSTNVQMYKSDHPDLEAKTLAEVRAALMNGWKSNKDVPIERLVAELPADLHGWTKVHCSLQGVSIKNLVIALLLAYRQAAEEAEQQP